MAQTFQFRIGDDERTVQIEPDGALFRVRVGEQVFAISARAGDAGRLDLCVDGTRRRAYVARQKERTYVWLDGDEWTLAHSDARRRPAAQPSDSGGLLAAAMPGRVLDVLVREGDAVQRGAPLVLLEAMKMELRIQAAKDGVVSRVLVAPGQVVERGERLVEID